MQVLFVVSGGRYCKRRWKCSSRWAETEKLRMLLSILILMWNVWEVLPLVYLGARNLLAVNVRLSSFRWYVILDMTLLWVVGSIFVCTSSIDRHSLQDLSAQAMAVLNVGKNKEHKSKDSLSKENTIVFLCHTLLPLVLSRPEGLVLVFSARPSRGERVP